MRLLLLFISLFLSCKAENIATHYKSGIEFINSQCENNSIPTQSQLEANFRVLYYGPKMEHIVVDLSKSYSQFDMFTHFNEVMGISDLNIVQLIGGHPLVPTNDYASIHIDTSIIVQTDFLLNESKSGVAKKLVCASHYPIIIENMHVSFFTIGYDEELNLTYEAQSPSGKWKPISHPPIRFCGTGLMSVPLAAKEIVISALPITEGHFKTKGRLCLGDIFSNEISISIDTSAFHFPK